MPENQKFGKRLVQAGVITQEQLEEALKHQGLEEGRLGELLVRLGYVSESTILQFLAAEFRTRYVSTERLARARIPQQVLDLLPVQLAERYNLIPVLYDTETQTLSVVTSEPQNEDNLREVHMMTSVRELRVYVALQPAVQAAIRKHYRGEINAFKELLYQEGDADSAAHASNPPRGEAYGTPHAQPGQPQSMGDYLNQPNMYGSTPPPNPYDPASPYGTNAPYSEANPYGYNYNNYQYGDPTNYPTSYENAYQEGSYDDDVTRLHANPYLGNEGYQPNNQGYYYPQEGAMGHMPTQAPGDFTHPMSPMSRINVLELTRFFVGQLEQHSPRYKEHTARQRPLMEILLRRLNFSPEESQPLWLALYLHHAHTPEEHKSLLTLDLKGEELEAFQQQHLTHINMLSRMHLPDETIDALRHMYERGDGNGFPQGLKQEEIPLGARLLAFIDAYEDLSYQDSSPSLESILQQLKEHSGTLFDERLLNILEEEKLRLEQYIQGTIPHILLLDPDIHLVNELEQLLWGRGFWVQTAHSLAQAEALFENDTFDLVVLELDFGPNQDAFAWMETYQNSTTEFIILTQRQDELDRGMDLARDYLVKPMSANIIVAKLNKQLNQIEAEKLQRQSQNKGLQGLAGALEQIGLPEILQVLSQSRRTGRLTIHTGKQTGYIYLEEGEVVNALNNDTQGEAAFGHMMAWNTGEFNFEPDITTDEKLINKRLDGLILDSLRVLDESKHRGIEDPFAGFSSSDSFPDLEMDNNEDFFDLNLNDDEPDSPNEQNKP